MNQSFASKIAGFFGLLAAILTFGAALTSCHDNNPDKTRQGIVILFDTDVHCYIDGYAKMAGLRDAIADTAWVALVQYVTDALGGHIGQPYAEPQGRITIKTE